MKYFREDNNFAFGRASRGEWQFAKVDESLRILSDLESLNRRRLTVSVTFKHFVSIIYRLAPGPHIFALSCERDSYYYRYREYSLRLSRNHPAIKCNYFCTIRAMIRRTGNLSSWRNRRDLPKETYDRSLIAFPIRQGNRYRCLRNVTYHLDTSRETLNNPVK